MRQRRAAASEPLSFGHDAARIGAREIAGRRFSGGMQRVLSNYGLVVFGVVLVMIYAIILPDTFLSSQTFRAVMGASVIVTFLALAEMIVIASGNYDLSVAYGIGLLHILAMGMLVQANVPWPPVVMATVMLGGLIGLANGLLVEYAKIDSFIATLGVGTILYGLGAWYTNGAQIVGNIPAAFAAINDDAILGVPLPAVFVLALVLVLWVCFEFLPVGRRIYAVGGNRKAAELTGIPARRLVIGAFVASGAIVGFAAVILAARLQVGQSAVGPEFLLPAFVGALLGSTTIRPGPGEYRGNNRRGPRPRDRHRRPAAARRRVLCRADLPGGESHPVGRNSRLRRSAAQARPTLIAHPKVRIRAVAG